MHWCYDATWAATCCRQSNCCVPIIFSWFGRWRARLNYFEFSRTDITVVFSTFKLFVEIFWHFSYCFKTTPEQLLLFLFFFREIFENWFSDCSQSTSNEYQKWFRKDEQSRFAHWARNGRLNMSEKYLPD